MLETHGSEVVQFESRPGHYLRLFVVILSPFDKATIEHYITYIYSSIQ
jgi:hypothetical protein